MYKKFKLTKRYEIAFHIFPKSAKEIKTIKPVYHTGIYKTKDIYNGFSTYFFVLYRFRILLYVEHKHKCGQCAG